MKRSALIATVLLLLGGIMQPASAAHPSCLVRIQGTVGDYLSLQTAIDVSPAGARLNIRGTCVGNFVLQKDITLIGKGSSPTLDGNGTGSVLEVDFVTVTVRDLRITNGLGTKYGYGGGIIDWGTLRLKGSTSVDHNVGPDDGGGMVVAGKLSLFDQASVTDNTATDAGGGVWFAAGHLRACTSWTGAISPNTPDDSPPVQLVSC